MRNKRFMTLRIRSPVLLALTFLILFSAQVTGIRAANQTAVQVDPPVSSAAVGANFTINVTITDVENLYALEVDLYWNASVLDIAKIDVRLGLADGALYNPILPIENSTQEGKYVLAATSYKPAPPFNGTGNIVTVTFNVKNPGTSSLNLEAQLADYSPDTGSSPIDHSTINGTFNSIIPEMPNIAILLVFATLTAAVAVFSQRILSRTRPKRVQSRSRQLGQNLLVKEKGTRYAGKRE